MGICGSTSKVQSGSAGVYCVYGPPGSVKTQLCEVLSAEHEYGVITLGEAQRRAIRDNEELGPKVKEAIEEKVASDKEARKEGKPVEGGPAGSDDLNADILQWLISGDQSSAASGWLIDGFPMTKKQHSLLAKRGVHVKKAVVVSVDDEVLVKLATSRRMDLETKTLYHLEGWGGNAKPPDDAQVQARLTTRADDSEDKARERIQDYKATFGEVGKLFKMTHDIDGQPFIEGAKVVADIIGELKEFLSEPIAVPKEVKKCVQDMIKKLEEEAAAEAKAKEEGGEAAGAQGDEAGAAPAPAAEEDKAAEEEKKTDAPSDDKPADPPPGAAQGSPAAEAEPPAAEEAKEGAAGGGDASAAPAADEKPEENKPEEASAE